MKNIILLILIVVGVYCIIGSSPCTLAPACVALCEGGAPVTCAPGQVDCVAACAEDPPCIIVCGEEFDACVDSAIAECILGCECEE